MEEAHADTRHTEDPDTVARSPNRTFSFHFHQIRFSIEIIIIANLDKIHLVDCTTLALTIMLALLMQRFNMKTMQTKLICFLVISGLQSRQYRLNKRGVIVGGEGGEDEELKSETTGSRKGEI